MCELFSHQPQENYQIIAKSIRIDGHATSIKLEASFWHILEEIAQLQGMTLPKFISTIYLEALVYNDQVKNFTSLLRCACLIYLSQPENVMSNIHQQLQIP
ncbi:DNA-binding protein [Vibrio sp. OCN044]|uniref:DNA-binding protein n=1 Tax=Vibrio tetraodonis subsp. pristinus TaxID=2695891 RepID=A0A6L8LY03_9VIBR|nr:ribbon-helix-helix domain-containing protein [Vibrio tetraodonis]MYM58072.1 DNA-binding protein [Vibrio tetraodonis subsp. pristinus]